MRDTDFGDYPYRRRFSFRKKMIFIPFLALGALALISYIVMLLWNALIPVIFHVGVISFWQAAGLLILSKILFGFGHGGHRGDPWMRHRMAERFKNMSPEEQQRFREQMRSRCGKWGRHRDGFDWDQPAESATKPAEDASKPVE
jgi:cytochrome b subunit of formate dehydrogenase